MRGKIAVLALAALGVALSVADGYDVVLKSGRVVKGTLVKEDASEFILKNEGGMEFKIKKANADLDKTAASNAKSTDGAPAKSRGRTYTKDDLERLREEHNLGKFEGAVEVKMIEIRSEKKIQVDEGFTAEVLDSKIPVLVDFFATWCGPCKKISPRVDAVGSEFSGRAKIYRVDIDKNPELSAVYNISAVPTLLFFKNGEVVAKMVGLAPKEAIAKKLKQVVETS
jgi:thioredoxin